MTLRRRITTAEAIAAGKRCARCGAALPQPGEAAPGDMPLDLSKLSDRQLEQFDTILAALGFPAADNFGGLAR